MALSTAASDLEALARAEPDLFSLRDLAEALRFFAVLQVTLPFDPSPRNVCRLWKACEKTCPHLADMLVSLRVVHFNFNPCLGDCCQCRRPSSDWRQVQLEIDFRFVEGADVEELCEDFLDLTM